MRRRIPGLAAWIVAGVGLGLLAGAAVALSATGRPHRLGRTVADTPPPAVTHVAPLLRAPGEPAELRYDVYCDPCSPTGTVFARPGLTGPFQAFRPSPSRSPGSGPTRRKTSVPGSP